MGDRGGTRFNILGPLEVTLGERSVAVPTGRLRSVLALLVLGVGRPVSVNEVAERLWPERMPERVRGTVHTYIARLRRLLGDDLIQTSYGGRYRMAVAADDVDLCRFRDMVRDSRTAPSGKAELAMLEEALGLWRGRAFADMDDAWLDQEVVPGLTEEWLTAVERHIELRLHAGRAGEVIAELRELIVGYPTRELLWLRLIEALHRTGRRVEALDAYRRLRTVLAEEFGIDPSDTLQRMQRAILMSGPPLAGPTSEVIREMPPEIAGVRGRAEFSDRHQPVPLIASEVQRLTALVAIGTAPGTAKSFVDLRGYGRAGRMAPSAVSESSRTMIRPRPTWGGRGPLPGRDGKSKSYDEFVTAVVGLTGRPDELLGRLDVLDADNARLVAENEALRAHNAELRRGLGLISNSDKPPSLQRDVN